MALDHVVKHIDKNEFNASQIPCLPCYCFRCPALSPPPPLLPLPHHASPHHLTLLLFIIVSILGVCFLFVSYYTIFSKFCWYRNRRTTPPQTEVNGSHEEFLDENHPTLIDHPIWFITTVGLDQPTITSITVFKYKKEEGVVEGSDCSVCLSEFQEDESLRLLPKCSHAFHLPCIDTWLRSHTNCPLCRAPIVSVANSSVRESNSNGSGSREETQIESSVGDGEVRRDVSEEVAEEERVLQEVRNDCEIGKGCEFQRLDKVLDGDRVVEDEVQSVRRSVSMDSSILCSPASVIVVPVEGEASSSAEVVEEKDIGLIGNCSSSGKSIWKGAVSMTRSISASGKLLSSKSSQCRGSILPLNPSDMRQNGSGVSLIGDFNRSNKLVLHGKIEEMLKFLGESNNHWIIKGEL